MHRHRNNNISVMCIYIFLKFIEASTTNITFDQKSNKKNNIMYTLHFGMNFKT